MTRTPKRSAALQALSFDDLADLCEQDAMPELARKARRELLLRKAEG